MSIHKKSHTCGPLTQFVKGAPERILKICSRILINGEIIDLTDDHSKDFNRAYEKLASKGKLSIIFLF